MTKAARRATIDAVIRLLCDSFPQTFSRSGQHPRPLKVGVYADALAALGGAIPARDLKSALRAYASRASYLHALTAGAPRVGWGSDARRRGGREGEACGVSETRGAGRHSREGAAYSAHWPQDTGPDPCH